MGAGGGLDRGRQAYQAGSQGPHPAQSSQAKQGAHLLLRDHDAHAVLELPGLRLQAGKSSALHPLTGQGVIYQTPSGGNSRVGFLHFSWTGSVNSLCRLELWCSADNFWLCFLSCSQFGGLDGVMVLLGMTVVIPSAGAAAEQLSTLSDSWNVTRRLKCSALV